MVNFKFKEKYNCNDLIEIIGILRHPGGCPWDIEQTHQSIKRDLIEETYEVIEAINKDDKTLLQEELGDLLMQIVFHSGIETDSGNFDFDDVCDGICKKMIIRHPHVFGDVNADTVDKVLVNWDVIKMETKGQKTVTDAMLSVPRELPALIRAEKIQKKAAKAGFDWDDVSGAVDKLYEEIGELKQAIENGDRDNLTEEFGDFLFSAVNTSRYIKVDAELALTAASDKFLNRFEDVEKKAKERNINMTEAPLEVLDALWDEVKAEQKK